MDEKAKIREIMDGLERLRVEHSSSSFPDLERVRAICSVVPLGYPLTLSIFHEDGHIGSDYDYDLFLKFLAETGKEWGVCDDSERHPIMIYQRPDAEQDYDNMYTADGWLFDEGSGFGEDTWGGAINPAGWWMNNAPDTVETLVDTMWELCGGDVHVLLERLDEYDGGLRVYRQEADGYFEDEWEWKTWEAFGVWCKQRGIEQPPFPVEWSCPNGWDFWDN